MSWQDLVNGLFECGGAVSCWLNALALYRSKSIKGVYWPVFGFYSLWGLWNLVYYPSLGQWLSFFAGIVLCAGNVAWTLLALRLYLRGLK